VAVRYRERLRAPIRWWVVAALLVASVFVAVDVPVGPRVSLPVTAVVAAGTAALLVRISRAEVVVDAGGLRAGRATLPPWAIGDVEPLDAAATRRLRGPDADVRAYDLQRPWVATAVRVTVADPADPTPYWLVATRHPAELAQALSELADPGERLVR
jgi:hypothetical protein